MEDTPQKYYEDNPYQANSGGGEERMSVVRAALMLSLGIIISVGIVVLFLHHKDRFTIVPQNKGIFVFDYRSSSLSFCNTKGCNLISVNADTYHHPVAEMPFMPQGYMAASPQYPMGFVSPQMMQQNPYMNPQYSPYMQQAYPLQQGFGAQPGWASPQFPMAPVQPMQQQQAFQEPYMQNTFTPEMQSQVQQQAQPVEQQEVQQQEQPQDQSQEQQQQ